MDSISDHINQLHASYCTAMALDLPMTPSYERLYWAALQMGLTPEMMDLAVRERMKLNLTSQFKMKLGIYNLIGTDDDTARVINEAAIVIASRRKKVMDPARASVLKATGRSTDLPQTDGQVVGKLMKDMRKAVE